MARSHPPTLLRLVERTLREECGVARGQTLLVAVSGGADSTALLHTLAWLRTKLTLRLAAHGVDHGLRPEATRELHSARELALALDVPFSASSVSVAPGSNLQARARAARYAALRQRAAELGADSIATGHHAGDRAETVLLRLLRGAGPRGLAVLAPRSGDLIRPLIRAGRPAVLAHLDRHGLRYCQDPSNRDTRFTRVRVRLEVLPLLEQLSPRVVEHLNALADQLAAGIPPEVLDASGVPIALNRGQIEQIRRAQQHHLRDARIRLSGAREVRIDGRTGRPVLADSAPEKTRA